MKTYKAILFSLAVLQASCAEPPKEQEEDIPADGKSDSFRNPTEHGPLSWAETYKPKFSEDTGWYHAYDFSISDDAVVTLESKRSSKTMDTVMYLYKYRESSQSWGSYIAKNDDKSGRTEFSYLERELEQGSYRVLLKPYAKSTSKGQGIFKFIATCDGAGCAVLPEAGTPSQDCMQQVVWTLGSQHNDYVERERTVRRGAAISDEYDLMAQLYIEQNVINYDGWLEDDGSASFRYFETQVSQGRSITVQTNYEVGAVFVFDTLGQLLSVSYDWEGESDVTLYYCEGLSGDDASEYFEDDDCATAAFRFFPFEQQGTAKDGSVWDSTVPRPVEIVLDNFADNTDITDEGSYSVITSGVNDFDEASYIVELFLSAEGEHEYGLIQRDGDWEILWSNDNSASDDNTDIICDLVPGS